MAKRAVLQFTERGIFCPAGGFYIDPWRPVDRALITHAHADHARPGHGAYLATHASLPVMRHRLGAIAADGIGYGEQRRIGDALVSFHPAGHVPGSAQIRVEVAGEVWVVSGDYKLGDDGLCDPFEPVRCHAFISECTFGLPVFRWRPQAQVATDILDWWQSNAAEGRFSLLGAYSLGKAQRLLHMLQDGPGPILAHAAVENVNAILRAQGLSLRNTTRVTPDLDAKAHPGALVIAPPSAFGSTWARRFGQASTGFASGWMQLRGVRRRRAMDRGFVVSDHADWPELHHAITETNAESIYVTHGYTETFAQYLKESGYDAHVVPTEFGTDEDDAEGAA
ncbi:ligase-associated DNA damage response exonuclease [Lutimaribacter sp. EGI FJ00015]|uniref:Ligase-associated DNA damage response exonuclease n=1 Tax=Lutimaribacter degradans TaxID=2945989 RepID=A0ACC5ZUF6_9RHOB|nr:ligase-associated DNA damage response exonuclease [Lutimaribacter sp. EGI FJ00013]MCM2561396.1 ligase-associated DNA damage response exonuclease [Lutimaribacter sp. EGI FJ00013]MCO0612894.1 ligase-associated DNA damage response exonuclease [Lutimaribacter sp. EGI FJ00015]MCO0635552.1 ligase-associated DNA damage response exonuclease [Lutimaribacter sp. EGI FJ00014]